MPFLMSQARTSGTATNYYAITHPSLPNYLALAGGSTFGIADDGDPDEHPLEGPSLFGQLVAAGRTAKTYADAMPTNCARENHADLRCPTQPVDLLRRFGGESRLRAVRCSCAGSPTAGALVEDLTAGNLPTFGLVVPDICNDGHDCSAAITDDWLQSWLPTIKGGPDFKSNRLAIVVTWDEDDEHSGNRVPMVVINPSLKG